MVKLAGSTHHLNKKYRMQRMGLFGGGGHCHTWALFYMEGNFNLNVKEFQLICAGQRDPRRTEMSARMKTSWLAGQGRL